MGDPISVAGTVVGSISLGIQVTQSLVNFYNSYKGQSSELGHTTNRLNSLLGIFQSLKKTLSERKFLADEQNLVKNIETSIQNCDDLVHELQDEVQKFNKTSSKEPIATIQIAGRRLTYPFRQSTLQKLDEDIKDIRANISSALDALHLHDNMKIQDDITETKALLGLVRTSQISLELRAWLNAPDASTDHYAACAKKQPGTGIWLVKSDQFSSWLTEENSIMWLNGFAGSGKSILCSTAINSVLRHKRSDPNIGIAFFYFTFNDKSKQDESAMLRALLLQLSNQAQNDNEDLTKLHQSHNTGVPPSWMLIDYLRPLVQRFRHVYIILDALDENPRSGSREHVLAALETMRNWGLQCLHLLVTSRDEPDIRESFDLLPAYQVKMQNSGIDKDIRDFISGRLDTDQRLKDVLPYRERVQESLAARAKGMFRWVDCQLQTLRSCLSEYHLDIVLSSLPESLDETYERILCSIDPHWTEDARRILTMLCFAQRPLTVQELIDSVAVEMGKSAGLNRKRRLWDSNGIRESCGGLVDIFLDGDVSVEDGDASVETFHKDLWTYDLPPVRIAHFSVQEYLESKRISGQKAASFGLNSITAHAEIAEVCLIYLLEPGLSRELSLSRSELNKAVLEEYPLAQFAATCWYYHYRKTENPTSGLDTCILRLFQSQTSFATWVRLHDVDMSDGTYFLRDNFLTPNYGRRMDDIQAPIYYASLLGLDKVLQKLLPSEQVESTKMSAPSLTNTSKASKQTVSAAGRHGGAMQAASYNGHDHIVQILLDSGFDVNAQGDYYPKSNSLHIASSAGHAKVVQILLDRGADVNPNDSTYSSALLLASVRGFKEVVRLLIDGGANVNANNSTFGSALQSASAGGFKEVVRLLLDGGADVNANDSRYSSALQSASAGGFKEVVRLLIDGGADVNAKDSTYSSALESASVRGFKEVVQILLDGGADVNRNDSTYGSALQSASAGGFKEVVRLLIDGGADVNANDSIFGSALQSASAGGFKEVVRLLLDGGADVNAQRGIYGSVLQGALAKGDEEVVQMLCDRGADVNEQHGWNSTALFRAAESGKGSLVQILLDAGARISISQNRALPAAIWGGHSNIVQMLLDNMDAEDFDNEWRMASSKGGPWDDKIIELLRNHDFPFRREPPVTEKA